MRDYAYDILLTRLFLEEFVREGEQALPEPELKRLFEVAVRKADAEIQFIEQ